MYFCDRVTFDIFIRVAHVLTTVYILVAYGRTVTYESAMSTSTQESRRLQFVSCLTNAIKQLRGIEQFLYFMKEEGGDHEQEIADIFLDLYRRDELNVTEIKFAEKIWLDYEDEDNMNDLLELLQTKQ